MRQQPATRRLNSPAPQVWGVCKDTKRFFRRLRFAIPLFLTVEGPQLAVGQHWVANSPWCRILTIQTYNESSGIFSGVLSAIGGLGRAYDERYIVNGFKSPRGNTIGWTVGESSLCSVATYSGRLEYLANNDPVITTAYLISHESTNGKTEVGFDQFYPSDICYR